jgi:16S rRNA processing protein RimM
MKLFSVDDRDRAEELRGAVLCARRDRFPPLESGEFYACDVEGARVVLEEQEGERVVGHVAELRSYPTVDVLVVAPTDDGRPWEVPLVDSVVRGVDVDRGIVTLSTMEGVERG